MKSIEEKNNVKMVIIAQEEIDGTEPALKVLQINGDPKNVENAAVEVESILNDAKIQMQRIVTRNSISFDEGGSEFECPLCCGIYDIVNNGSVTCIPFKADSKVELSTKNLHTICVNCIKEYSHSAITGRVAPGGLGLNCVVDKCPNIFLIPSFEKYLDDEIRKPFLERLQEQCVLDTDLKDLVTCPECGYKVCVPHTDTFYDCECGRRQCRNCPKLYDAKHFGKTCKQLAEEEARNASSQKPETKMSEIVIRKCYKCGKQFVKIDACNLMESCPCGAKQCYICNEPEVTPAHFCKCENSVKHGRCPKCKKTCRQFEDDKELDDIRLSEFQKQNGTNITLPNLPTIPALPVLLTPSTQQEFELPPDLYNVFNAFVEPFINQLREQYDNRPSDDSPFILETIAYLERFRRPE
uniref:RING-type domain-containing protein n=1 Tax=Panagrolaimus sp. PS1159 TaxID=55785 RepID=A0AC35GBW8_9BILA